MLDLVAKYASMWNCTTVADPELIPPIRAMVDEACDRNDRPRQTLDRSNGLIINLPGWQGHYGMTSVRQRRARAGVFNGDYRRSPRTSGSTPTRVSMRCTSRSIRKTPQGVEQFGRVIELLG
ncbi:MAG: hypothetical protein R2839_03645 [Thermomicrobiales bacterium]